MVIGDLRGLVGRIRVLAVPGVWEDVRLIMIPSLQISLGRYGLGLARAGVERVQAGEDRLAVLVGG